MCLYKKLLKHADSLLSKRTNTGQQDMYGRTFMQSLFSFSSLLSFPSFFSFSLFSHSAFFLRSLCSWTECWFYSKPKKLSLLLKKGWKKTVSLVLLRLEPETLKKHKHWLVHANTHTPTHTLFPSLPQALNTSVSCWVELLSSIPQSIIYTNVCLVVNQIMCPAGRVLHILWLQESQVIWKWNASV